MTYFALDLDRVGEITILDIFDAFELQGIDISRNELFLLAKSLGLKDDGKALTYKQLLHKVISDQDKFTIENIYSAFKFFSDADGFFSFKSV